VIMCPSGKGCRKFSFQAVTTLFQGVARFGKPWPIFTQLAI
jgi:hypothetical protein